MPPSSEVGFSGARRGRGRIHSAFAAPVAAAGGPVVHAPHVVVRARPLIWLRLDRSRGSCSDYASGSACSSRAHGQWQQYHVRALRRLCKPRPVRQVRLAHHPRMHGGGVWDSAPHSNDGHDHDPGHMHSHNHSHSHTHGRDNCSGDDHNREHARTRISLSSLLVLLDKLRHSLRAACTGAALLGASTAASAAGAAVVPIPVRAAALGACLALTGVPALAEVIQRLAASRGRDLDTDTLMAIAALAALAAGAAAEAALLTTLYALSHAVEHAVTARARADLDTLRDLAPQFAWRVPPENLTTPTPERVAVVDIHVHDNILVRLGEIVPCDAVVVNGAAFVVVQHLTGESTPRAVSAGEHILAGARVVDAPLVVCVTKIGAESTLARISRLVTSAQANRPRVTRFFDRYSRLYTRTIISIAALLVAFLPLLGGTSLGGKNGSIKRSLGFLVAASPCALVIGAPVAYLASLSACARRGVLVKSGPKALDATAEAKHIVFDKTGTLTTGDLAFVSVLALPPEHSWSMESAPLVNPMHALQGDELNNVLAIAVALERGAVHPIAVAVSDKAAELNLETSHLHLDNLMTVPGQGVEAMVRMPGAAAIGLNPRPSSAADGRSHHLTPVRLGRMSYIIPSRPWLKNLRDQVSNRGELLVSALRHGDETYLLLFRDQVRTEAAAGIALLKRQGLKISLLTGDSSGSAHLVERSVGGLDEVIANATPEGKLEYIRALQNRLSQGASEPRGVIMVGDGVNDAPALAAATVGIACGLSSATAVHSADVVLVRTDLQDLAWYVRKASRTQLIVKQNLAIALVLMLIAVTFTLSGAAPLWMAVVLHEGGTVLVGLNGLRLLSDRMS
jgi:Zn2+/Cd2+-exporting ATPase